MEVLMEPVPEDLGIIGFTREQREDVRVLYDNVGETRNADVTIRWYISAVMFTLNAALLPFGLDRALKGEPLGIVVGLTEVVSVVLWFFLEMRMEGVIQYWNSKLIAGEEMLCPVMRVFGGEEYVEKVSGVRIRTHYILILTIMFFGFLGVCIVVISSAEIPRTPTVLQSGVSGTQDGLEVRVQRLESRIEELQEQMVVLSRKARSVPKDGKKAPRPRREIGR